VLLPLAHAQDFWCHPPYMRTNQNLYQTAQL